MSDCLPSRIMSTVQNKLLGASPSRMDMGTDEIRFWNPAPPQSFEIAVVCYNQSTESQNIPNHHIMSPFICSSRWWLGEVEILCSR